MSPKKKVKQKKSRSPDNRVTFYPAWCKRCGNCVAFCPRKALDQDEWGFPFMAGPERCISCHMCEMLCPDFAIGVGETPPTAKPEPSVGARPRREPAAPASPHPSPERLAPVPRGVEEDEPD